MVYLALKNIEIKHELDSKGPLEAQNIGSITATGKRFFIGTKVLQGWYGKIHILSEYHLNFFVAIFFTGSTAATFGKASVNTDTLVTSERTHDFSSMNGQ